MIGSLDGTARAKYTAQRPNRPLKGQLQREVTGRTLPDAALVVRIEEISEKFAEHYNTPRFERRYLSGCNADDGTAVFGASDTASYHWSQSPPLRTAVETDHDADGDDRRDEDERRP